MEYGLGDRAFLLAVFFLFMLTGCVSTQRDISISAEETADSELVSNFESRLITLDGQFVLNGKLSAEEKTKAAAICSDIDKSLETPMLDKVVQSRLLAIKGRVQLMAGGKSDATKTYNQAKKLFENDVQVVILGRRLGNLSILSYKSQSESEVLAIEAAIENYENGQFDLAAGLFDSAFLASGGFYTKAYSELRSRAWELKNISSGDNDVSFWLAQQITVAQMMELAQRHPGLLDYFTGGRQMDSSRLFKALVKAGVMDSISAVEGEVSDKKTALSESTNATRVLAARFLWNLYVTRKNVDSTKYSKRYRNRQNSKSPVADIDITCEDFDAVLGAVENEIMSLIDGKNFEPEGNVSAPEMDGCLNKLQ